MSNPNRILLGTAISLLLSGCGAGPSPGSEDPERTAEPLTKERDGTILFNDAARRENSNITLRGYAASIQFPHGGCSGAMVGPNVFMTAGHCSFLDDSEPDERTIRFRMSRKVDRYGGDFLDESFECVPLLRAFDDTDLMLYYCPPNAGVNPGDKYGYLDFEVALTNGLLNVAASRERAVVDKPVWTFWQNNLVEPTAISNVIFRSRGKITSRANSDRWFAIQGGCSDEPAPILRADVWVKSGVSGASTLSDIGRIVGGPTSTASSSADGAAGLGTNAIIDYLTRTRIYSPQSGGRCDGKSGAQLHSSNLADLGLSAANYADAVDKNNDGLFDVQLAAQWAAPQVLKTMHYLGFESHLRNSMTLGANPSTFWISPTDVNHGYAQLQAFQSLGFPKVAARGTIQIRGYALATVVSTIQVCARGCTSFTIPATGAWARFTASTTATGAPSILVTNGGPVKFSEITVTEVGTQHKFDLHDSRMAWRDSSAPNSNALFLPLGTDGTQSASDFALAINLQHDASTVQLPFVATTRQQRLCFDTKLDSRAGAAVTLKKFLVEVNDSGGARNHRFDAPASWTRLCTTGAVLNSSTTRVRFSTDGGDYGYLVDNVGVEQL